jgi:prolyl-tRNA synthetase
MLDVYADFCEQALALPVVKGPKTDSEKFPGADTTYAIEALMQDGKALQAGTSHNLGQNFAKAFDIKFLGRDQKQQHVWTTSWGVSTRLIGALVMAHSDDEGLVLPPRVAPNVAVIIPIFKTDEEKAKVAAFIDKLTAALCGAEEAIAAKKRLATGDLTRLFFDKVTGQCVVVDWRDNRPGDKQFHWEQRGVPFRFEVGPRDVDASSAMVKRRLDRAKEVVKLENMSADWLRGKLDEVQAAMLQRAIEYREQNSHRASSYDELKQVLEQKGGFVRCYFQPSREAEAKIKEETKATVRVIPLDAEGRTGKCIYSGKVGAPEVIFAAAY